MPCILSQREIGRLKNYGLQPNHKEHRHCSAEEAITLMAASQLYAVDEDQGYLAANTEKRWTPRPSGGHMVLQMVDR